MTTRGPNRGTPTTQKEIRMPIYRVIVSFTVEAENEEDATHVAQDAVIESDVVVETVKEVVE